MSVRRADTPRGPGGSERVSRAKTGRLATVLVALALVLPATPTLGAIPPNPGGASLRSGFAGFAQRDTSDGLRVEEAPFREGELLVAFHDAVPAAERARARSAHGLRFKEKVPLPGLERAAIRQGESVPEAVARVSADTRVRFAQPNYLYRPSLIPNDPEFPEQWGLHNTGQTGGTADADIDAPQAWDIAPDTSSIVVGVIDTGVKFDHPDLAANMWVNPGEIPGNGDDDDFNGFVDDVHGWDFFNDDPTVFDPVDLDDHGTHVAGTISAVIDNARDVAGVSDAKIMALKFIGPEGGFTSDAIAAIDYAIEMGAHVTNNSWGGTGSDNALKNKIAEAGVDGQLFVAAAGNFAGEGGGKDIDSDPVYPAAFDLANIVSVAATNHNDGLAGFSNFGDVNVDLGAPGVAILSTIPFYDKAVLVGPDVDSSGDHTIAYHTFGLEGVIGSSDRNALMSAAIGRIGIATSDPILLVDDDAGSSMQTYYQTALTALGYTSVTTTSVPGPSGPPQNPSCSDGPAASNLESHDLVIWLTGADFQCTLTSTDRSNLTSYLGGGAGHNLLLFGQDIGFDLTNNGSTTSSFMENVLRVGYEADFDLNSRVVGVPSTPYAGVDLDLDPRNPEGSGPDEGQIFSSGVRALSGAKAGLRGGRTDSFSGTSMATPHVSGAVAQMIAAFPAADYSALKCRLLATTDVKGSLLGKTVSGGRLNLHRALDTSVPGCLGFRLEPFSATNVVGESHTVRATLTHAGEPVPDGTLVHFEASGTGKESPTSASVPTSDGVATFSFTSGRIGTSKVKATVGATGGSKTVTKRWVCPSAVTSGFFAYSSSFFGGVFVAAGDVNGDGCEEIITGAGRGGGPLVRVFSGRTGALMHSFFAYSSGFTGGVRVAAADINGDGKDEIITGVGPGGGPHLKVFSGDGTRTLRSFFPYAKGFTGGLFVSGGDVNGDGKDDVITGVGDGGGPHVRVFSEGDPSKVIHSFFAYSTGFRGGVRVAAGHFNVGNKADIVTGVGPGGGPHVKVFNGASLGLMRSFFAYSRGFTGGLYVAAGDVSGADDDVITGVGPGGGPHVKVFSFGIGGSVIRSFFAYSPGFTGGVRVSGADIRGTEGGYVVTGPGPGGGPHIRVFP